MNRIPRDLDLRIPTPRRGRIAVTTTLATTTNQAQPLEIVRFIALDEATLHTYQALLDPCR